MKKFFEEFKTFAMRGNVVDLAVGVVIGGAFGKITTSIVNDIIMPIISLLTGGLNFNEWQWVLKEAVTKVNAAGVRNLAVAAETVRAKLVHVSTDYVFAGNGTVPYTECYKTDPQSVYGKSKALGEQYAMSFCKRSFVVRTSWLYGYIGKNFVKTVRRIMRERGAMTVVNDQRGNPTNANDLAHHILKLCVTNEYGIYHCTGKGECTWFDFAAEIVKLSGIAGTVSPCSSEEYPSPVKRPAYSSLSHLALDCAVGDQMRAWQDALKEYIMKVEE